MGIPDSDRKKDMIIAGGFNTTRARSKRCCSSTPGCWRWPSPASPNEYRGETVKAYVVLKPGQTATAEELIAFFARTARGVQGTQAG